MLGSFGIGVVVERDIQHAIHSGDTCDFVTSEYEFASSDRYQSPILNQVVTQADYQDNVAQYGVSVAEVIQSHDLRQSDLIAGGPARFLSGAVDQACGAYPPTRSPSPTPTP